MMIHEITPKAGSHRKGKRLGRGIGSGKGKTSGRGHKGQQSRSGYSIKPGHEGGQMPFFRRIPKRGFTNAPFRKEYVVVNVKALDARFEDGAEVTPAALAAKGLIPNDRVPVKVLGEGETGKKLSVQAAAFSRSAQEKIAKAGGSTSVLG